MIRRKSVGPKADHDAEARDSGAHSVDRAADHRNCCRDRLISRAVRTGLSTSTEYRLLTTLEKYSFVPFDRTESKWRVGAQSFAVRATFTRRRNVVAQATPYLRGLRDQTRETANLAVVDNESIMVLTRVESREIMRSLTKGRRGCAAIVAYGAPGRAVLASYLDQNVSAIIHRHDMPRLTENQSYMPANCSGRFEPSSRGGYAVNDGEARIRQALRCCCGLQ